MADRVLLGKNPSGNVGLWVSKPGVNVMSFAGNTFLDATKDWYGYQEEFLGSTEGAYHIGVDLVNDDSGFSATDDAVGIKRTANGTIAYYANSADPNLFGNSFRTAGKVSMGAFAGRDYPVVEMKVRMVPPASSPNLPSSSSSDLILFFASQALSYEVSSGNEYANNFTTESHGSYTANAIYFSGLASPPRHKSLGKYTDYFTDNEWKYLEWDMSDIDSWMDTYKYMKTVEDSNSQNNPHPYSGEYLITQLRFDLNHNGYEGYNSSGDPPMWEIDYVRVKKLGIPVDSGSQGRADDSLLFSSNWLHSGLVHQTGLVQIGNGKATIDGLAEITNGRARSDPAARGTKGGPLGHVEIVPPLEYVPLILFQRIDSVTDAAFPAGEKEFSYCTTESSMGNNAPIITNTELRTFAYLRASNSYFELTCRGALARDGLEWAFNYSNQYTPSQGGSGDIDALNYYPFAAWGDRVNPDFFDNRFWTTPETSNRYTPGRTGLYRRGMGDWGMFPTSRILHEHANTAGITAIDSKHPIRGKHWMGLPWVKAQSVGSKVPGIRTDGAEIESSININTMELKDKKIGSQSADGTVTSFWGTTSEEVYERFSSTGNGTSVEGQSNTSHPYELKSPRFLGIKEGIYDTPAAKVANGYGGIYPNGEVLFQSPTATVTGGVDIWFEKYYNTSISGDGHGAFYYSAGQDLATFPFFPETLHNAINKPAAVWLTHHADGAVSKWNHSLQDLKYSLGTATIGYYYGQQGSPGQFTSASQAGTGGAYASVLPADAAAELGNTTNFYLGSNSSGVCHPYGVVPINGTLNASGQEDSGVVVDGVSGISTYFSNYSMSNNQTSYIGGSPYKNTIVYNGDGTVANTNHQKEEESEFADSDYSHNTPTYRYYVLRVPIEYNVGG